jgi:hypothetical protein
VLVSPFPVSVRYATGTAVIVCFLKSWLYIIRVTRSNGGVKSHCSYVKTDEMQENLRRIPL